MIEKATGLAADQVFLDLEDSVIPDAKVKARATVASSVNSLDWGERVVAVRVNDMSSPWGQDDIGAVAKSAGPRLDLIIVPKVESAAQVELVDRLLAEAESESGRKVGSIAIELQIETAPGLTAVDEIANESERTEALVFGPGDMAASLGMPSLVVGELREDYPGDPWHTILMRILVAARSAGLQAIDGPFAGIDDPDGYRASAARSRLLGYDGKWAIHPSQIDIANEVYGVSQAEFERASDIVGAYTEAGTEGRGAAMFGREMIDEATRKMAQSTLDKGRQQGVVARRTDSDVPFHERAVWRNEHRPLDQ